MRIGLDARLIRPGLGIATYVGALAEALVRRGDSTVVWIGPGGAAPTGVEVLDAAAHWPYPLLDGPAGRRLLRGRGLDVVHLTGNTGWHRPGPAPMVLTVHDLIPFRAAGAPRPLRQRLGHAYVRANVGDAVRAAAEVITGSATTAAAVGERFGRRPVVIPHGVRRPAVAARAPDAPPYLVAFAGRDPRKGTDLALAVHCAAGDAAGPLHLVARAGLPDGVTAAGDRRVVVHRDLDRERLDALLAGATALLYLSRDEGFGLPVLEAMAAGTPVITGNAPATREIAGDAALLVDPADPVGSALGHVRALLADPGRRTAVVRRGRAHAAHHDWATVAERHLEVYRRVAA